MLESLLRWVNSHRDEGHKATVTVVSAPGSGYGSWCFTCQKSGPTDVRILSLEEVR